MKMGAKNMAVRMVAGQARFIEFVIARGFTKAQAEKIYEVYRKARVLKVDAVNGSFSVTHGAFLDDSTLTNAANQ